MKLRYIYEGKKTFLSYPNDAITLHKVYDVFENFEIPNTLFFIGDDGKTWKIIPGFFEKVKK